MASISLLFSFPPTVTRNAAKNLYYENEMCQLALNHTVSWMITDINLLIIKGFILFIFIFFLNWNTLQKFHVFYHNKMISWSKVFDDKVHKMFCSIYVLFLSCFTYVALQVQITKIYMSRHGDKKVQYLHTTWKMFWVVKKKILLKLMKMHHSLKIYTLEPQAIVYQFYFYILAVWIHRFSWSLIFTE